MNHNLEEGRKRVYGGEGVKIGGNKHHIYTFRWAAFFFSLAEEAGPCIIISVTIYLCTCDFDVPLEL